MKKQVFESFAESAGLRVVGTNAYGILGEYPVLAYNRGGAVQVVYTLRAGEASRNRRALKKALKRIGSFQLLGKDQFLVSLSGKGEVLLDRFRRMAASLADAFRENGIGPADTCPICKASDCDTAAHYKNAYTAIHSECMKNHREAAVEKAGQNEENGSYLLGLVGGILGGIVACIPNILSIWFAETAYAILYALIPLGVYYGYKLLGGKLNKVAIAITIILSILFGMLVDVSILAIVLVLEEIPLYYLGEILMDPEILPDMIGEWALSLVFIAFGVFATWKMISRTAQSSVMDADSALKTMQPLEAANMPFGHNW